MDATERAPLDPAVADGDLLRGTDDRLRCWWTAGDEVLERYHDLEWGKGPRDETGLFERLSLEAFQAGLSWRLVLQRREALRSAFLAFDPPSVAGFSEQDVDRVLALPGVIRNRAKIAAITHNARVLVGLHRAGTGLRSLTEEIVAAEPLGRVARPRRREEVPSSTPISVALSRRLRSEGWRFVGPVTAYAYLQAAGWVDDHLVGCHALRSPSPTPPLR